MKEETEIYGSRYIDECGSIKAKNKNKRWLGLKRKDQREEREERRKMKRNERKRKKSKIMSEIVLEGKKERKY